MLTTHAVVQASLFTHARSDGADIVVTAGDETTRLKRELVTYDAMAGELELYVKIPSLPSGVGKAKSNTLPACPIQILPPLIFLDFSGPIQAVPRPFEVFRMLL